MSYVARFGRSVVYNDLVGVQRNGQSVDVNGGDRDVNIESIQNYKIKSITI